MPGSGRLLAPRQGEIGIALERRQLHHRERRADAVDAAYRRALGRKPSGAELDYGLTYIESDPARMKELAWLLFNLDEFIYVR